MTLAVLLAALAVTWHAVAVIAWHGWPALTAIAAAALVALGAAQVAETAKTYNTEDRVNELTRRNWERVHPDTHDVGNNTAPNDISARYTIGTGEATANSQYEIYIEGAGRWGDNAGAPDLQFRLRAFGGEYGTFQVGHRGGDFAAAQDFEFWLRATITVGGVPGLMHWHLHGGLWIASGGPARVQANTATFGRDLGSYIPVNTNAGGQFWVLANFTAIMPGQRVSSYMTRISRRGA